MSNIDYLNLKFRYNTKTTQENLYQKLLKLIRDLISSKTKSQLKIRLSLIEPNLNALTAARSLFLPFVKFDHLKCGSFSPAKFKADSGEGSNLAAETRRGNIIYFCRS